VIEWSSHTTPDHERNAHEQRRYPQRARISGLRDGRKSGHHNRHHLRNQRPTARTNESMCGNRGCQNEQWPKRLARPADALVAENRGTESADCRFKRSSSANSDLQRSWRSEKDRSDSLGFISCGLRNLSGFGWSWAKHVGAKQPQIHFARRRDSIVTPLRYSLWSNLTNARDFIRPAKFINNLRITHATIKAYFKPAGQAHFNMVRICF